MRKNLWPITSRVKWSEVKQGGVLLTGCCTFQPFNIFVSRMPKIAPPCLGKFNMFERPHLFGIIVFSNMFVFQLLITELFYCLVFRERQQWSFSNFFFFQRNYTLCTCYLLGRTEKGNKKLINKAVVVVIVSWLIIRQVSTKEIMTVIVFEYLILIGIDF